MLGPKQSQLGELVLKLAYCQLTQTSNHGFGNWEKENDQTPKVLPFPTFSLNQTPLPAPSQLPWFLLHVMLSLCPAPSVR